MKDKKLVFNYNKSYQVYRSNGKNRVILICDHASNYNPSKYKNLGLNKNQIQRHIAWDIGVEAVAKKLSKKLNATLIMSGYSRLLIDCNRPFGASEAFIKKSENTIIPGNLKLSKKEKKYRAKKFCIPYRNIISKIIKFRMKKNIIPIIVSLHSFTPIYKGSSRPWHLGLLYRREKRIFSLLNKELSKDKAIKIGINEPYKCNLKGDFSIPYFAESNGLPCILLEIRQDLINTSTGVIKWSKKLSYLLNKVIFNHNIESSVRKPKDVLLYYKKRNVI